MVIWSMSKCFLDKGEEERKDISGQENQCVSSSSRINARGPFSSGFICPAFQPRHLVKTAVFSELAVLLSSVQVQWPAVGRAIWRCLRFQTVNQLTHHFL